MENKAHAIAAGIFVVLLTALLLGLASWLTRETGKRDVYEITTNETVTGLQEQAPVRFRGVDVGKVSSIGFDPEVPGNVLIRLAVDHDAPITKGTFAKLGFQGVTGLAFIQLDDTGKQPARLESPDGSPPRIPLQPGLLSKLEERGELIVDRITETTQRLNQLLGDENQKKLTLMLGNIGQASDSANQLAQRLNTTVDKRLDPALAAATPALQSIQRTADDFATTAKRLNAPDGPIDRLGEGTQALSHAADSFNQATLPRINRVTEDASRAVRQLGRTVNNINDNPQSLIFGAGRQHPGPGEPGFTPPGSAR